MSKVGRPGALPGSAREGAAATSQRVWAALGKGVASSRSRNNGTPDFCAASASRRLAVRSSSRKAPHPSTITAPSSAQRSASTAVFSKAMASGSTPTIPCPMGPPSSAQPVACKTPVA